MKRDAALLGRPIDPERVVLDFGCGWGRMTRFFLKDVRPENLHGADVSPSLVALCRESIPSCPFWLIDPMPPSTFDRDTFDVIYAYSVFSHLSERAHLRWIGEFARILKPGGVLLVTTRGRDFIALCHSLRGRTGGDPYRELLASAFPDPRGARRVRRRLLRLRGLSARAGLLWAGLRRGSRPAQLRRASMEPIAHPARLHGRPRPAAAGHVRGAEGLNIPLGSAERRSVLSENHPPPPARYRVPEAVPRLLGALGLAAEPPPGPVPAA